MTITHPLTDAELRQADANTKQRYLRILLLMQFTGCTFGMAVAAVQAADKG